VRLKPGRVILAALAVAGAGWWGWRAWDGRPGGPAGAAAGAPAVKLPPVTDTTARPPTDARVRVQVLNATRTRGLARRAMFVLRDRGWDVVEIGTTSPTRDSTLVLDRSGHPEWARRVAKALGGARVESRPDTSRYLDVTVLLGGTWRPPAEPFYP
jgi:hypothetical protein